MVVYYNEHYQLSKNQLICRVCLYICYTFIIIVIANIITRACLFQVHVFYHVHLVYLFFNITVQLGCYKYLIPLRCSGCQLLLKWRRYAFRLFFLFKLLQTWKFGLLVCNFCCNLCMYTSIGSSRCAHT